jgi:hypothetical protein
MFKNIFKSISLFLLLILNATLFTWYANMSDSSDKMQTFDKKLIPDVQAKPAIPVALPSIHTRIAKDSDSLEVFDDTLNAQFVKKIKGDQKIVLNFQSVAIRLEDVEESRLETLLNTLNINGAYTVRISSGPAPSEDKTDVSKTSKLRAQAVARVIYPYTQKITMFYLPDLAVGTVVVEISHVQHAKKP